MTTTVEDILEHHGIKGMKWGTRRKRGSDGRVTSSKSSSSGKTQFTKSPSRLSDAELNSRIKRIEMEKKYSDLTKSEGKPKSEGRKMAAKILKSSADTAMTQVGTQVMYYALKKSISNAVGEEKAKEMFPKKKK